ncbi:MAG: IS66 family insertion sequence hypothetical protein [Piscirickettsiaceae bacterium CG_4_9_14_3_um_filter_43_564]|nr:MAG: transposase [Thiomicrospira sp. CG2_30_44_34]PIQ03961.1 MAG: IS66 family insertion sequence hypothetical protein [Piscirickettsiaceae bacterium CG18_big_fil_WC_8_21_14_2_50_44_103]PIU38450.1 MAG: IS66 family insertion sequence hypothetical protein [Piscirickettsiaceae bacterium CG07_land_8_20_14_0_80_44_28]PIW78567.1 MAG: IS66 family insertion sequence hypothetical protein [Piscirickettsiaceae bacterium CG_4_8_14_3_um_filter_44_38]PIX80706.1 MAG: IS66 family insertion sequence hypotheti
MIHINQIWLATEPVDMRAGAETLLGRVVKVFGQAERHHAYVFTNKRANRIKVLIQDGLGIWVCARRLNEGKFHWIKHPLNPTHPLSLEQVQALVQGLPWQRIEQPVQCL